MAIYFHALQFYALQTGHFLDFHALQCAPSIPCPAFFQFPRFYGPAFSVKLIVILKLWLLLFFFGGRAYNC